MKKSLWIVAATAAVLVLMWGIYRVSNPPTALMATEEAQAEVERLAERFSAAIENERDVSPILDELKPIVDQRPDLRDGRQLLGQVYIQLNEVDKAYDQFMAALSIDPSDAPLQNLAGTAAMMRGNTRAAETHHATAVQLAPANPEYLMALADVYLKTQRWNDARNALVDVLGVRLTMHEANAALSDVYTGRGEPGDEQRAIDQLEQAIAKLQVEDKTLPTRIVYARKLARLYSQRDEPMEAVAILDSLPEPARLSPEVVAEMAHYLDQNGQPEQAALLYHLDVLAARPTDAEAAAAAARWYLKAGRPDAARHMVERLETINPRHPAIGEFRDKLSGM